MHIQHPGQVFPLLALACPSWKDSTSGGSGWQQSESPPALWMLGSGEQRKGENNFPQTFLLKDFRSDCHCCVSHLSKPQSFFLLTLLFCCLFLSPSGCQVPVSEELNYFRWHLLWGTNRSMFLLPLQWRSRWESAAASEHSLYKFNGRKEATGADKLPIFPPGVRLFVFPCLPASLPLLNRFAAMLMSPFWEQPKMPDQVRRGRFSWFLWSLLQGKQFGSGWTCEIHRPFPSHFATGL